MGWKYIILNFDIYQKYSLPFGWIESETLHCTERETGGNFGVNAETMYTHTYIGYYNGIVSLYKTIKSLYNNIIFSFSPFIHYIWGSF